MKILSATPPTDYPRIEEIGHSIITSYPLPVVVWTAHGNRLTAWEHGCASDKFRVLRLDEVERRQPVIYLSFEARSTQTLEFEANVGDIEPQPREPRATGGGGSGTVYLAGNVQGFVSDESGAWVVRWGSEARNQ